MGIIEQFLLALLLWFFVGTAVLFLGVVAAGWLVYAIARRARSTRAHSRSEDRERSDLVTGVDDH